MLQKKPTGGLYDPMIIPRVKQYLEENVHQTYVDVGVMARELQDRYREYNRRKAVPFRMLVEQAYKTVLHSYGLDSNPSTDNDDDGNSDLEVMDSGPCTGTGNANHMNDALTNMYMNNKNKPSAVAVSSENDGVAIDISSDEDDGCDSLDKDKAVSTTCDRMKYIETQIASNKHITVTKVTRTEKPKSGDEAVDSSNGSTNGPRKATDQLMTHQPKRRRLDNQQQNSEISNSFNPPTMIAVPAPRSSGTPTINKSSTTAAPTAAPRTKRFKKEVWARFVETTFDDIGGMDKILRDLCELLLHVKHPEVYRHIGLPPPRGFLLHGPPGSGKTLLAHAIAGQLKIGLIEVAATELVAGVSGESEERIRELFEQAAVLSPCVLFIDEIDAISANRINAQKDMERRIVAQLLSSLDGLPKLEGGDGVLIIGATNRPEALDPALRRVGRFDQEISLGIPDREARSQILKIICRNLKIQESIDYDELAKLTPGYVGADLLALATRAATTAIKRMLTERERKQLIADTKRQLEAEVIRRKKEQETLRPLKDDDDDDVAIMDVDETSQLNDKNKFNGNISADDVVALEDDVEEVVNLDDDKDEPLEKETEKSTFDAEKPIQEKPMLPTQTENKTSEEMSVENKPSEDKLLEDKLLEDKLLEDKLLEDKQLEEKPAADKPTEDKPAEDKPLEGKPTEDKPSENKPSEDKPVEDKPSEDKPSDNKPSEDKPLEDNSSENKSEKPVEEQSSEKKMTEEKTVEDKPVEHNEDKRVEAEQKEGECKEAEKKQDEAVSHSEPHKETIVLEDNVQEANTDLSKANLSDDTKKNEADVKLSTGEKSTEEINKLADLSSPIDDDIEIIADSSTSGDKTEIMSAKVVAPVDNAIVETNNVHANQVESMDVDAEVDVEKPVSFPQEQMEQELAEENDRDIVATPVLTLEKMLNLLLDNSNPLPDDELDSLYIERSDFIESLKSVQPSAKREGFITVPDVTWNDIGSLSDIRDELKLAILAPVKFPHRLKSLGLNSPSGVLLCGPPGCGKTLLAKAVANEAGINFISVKGPELLNMYVGESERAVRQCFQRARNSVPCVIFFDEFDSLCPKRSDNAESNSGARVVNQLLTEMDGIEDRKGVFLMAATNRPDIVDPAVLRPGRLDKILYVGLPGENDRVDILRALTKNCTQPPLANDVDLNVIARLTEGYTGADLAGLVRQASLQTLKASILVNSTEDKSRDGSEICLKVGMIHFHNAIRNIKPSVTDEDKKHYERLRQKYGTPIQRWAV